MKLEVEIDGLTSAIDISRDGQQKASVRIGERAYEIEVFEPESGVFLFRHDGRIYEAEVSPPDGEGCSIVTIRGDEFRVKVIDPKRLRGSRADSAHDGSAEIRTAMPGKVVRVLVEPGNPVKRSEGVVVVEAMKMQNELKSPKDGIVKEIRVAETDTVNAGQVLAVIE